MLLSSVIQDDQVVGACIAEHDADPLIEHVAIKAFRVQQFDPRIPVLFFGLQGVQTLLCLGDAILHLQQGEDATVTMYRVIGEI